MRSMLLGVAETGLELSPQATEGLFLSCEFCNPSASRRSAPPFTQGRRKVVVVAFATAVQICKCQSFSEGFQPCQHHALIGLSKPPALPVVMTIYVKEEFLPSFFYIHYIHSQTKARARGLGARAKRQISFRRLSKALSAPAKNAPRPFRYRAPRR